MKKTAIIFLILFIGAFFYAISSYVPCKPIIYTGSWCCLKVIPTIHDCPLWIRFIKGHNLIPNTTIKQAAIVDNIDMNYCKDINKIILR